MTAMFLDPSYLSPEIVFDPDLPMAEIEPKSGKCFGIIALLCGAECVLATLCCLLTFLFILMGMGHPADDHPWIGFVISLICVSPFCVIAGTVFGILGRNTRGRLYAYTGLMLSILYSLLVFAFVAYSAFMTCD